MTKKIIFRADGNSKIGLGHLYRVFSLIEMLKNEYEFIFLTREDSSLDVIPKEYITETIPLSLPINEEPNWLSNHFKQYLHIIIADGYQFTSTYQKQIKKHGFKLVYIDDLVSTNMYADIVINHSLGIIPDNYSKQNYTSFALGTNYSLLRPKFLELAKKERVLNKINSAFICFGGADPLNLTIKATHALINIKQFKHIHVVIGAAYKEIEIYKLKEKHPSLKIYQNLSEIELCKIMLECNFAITSASTVLYEICSVKMPVLSGYYVENQRKLYEEVAKRSIIIEGGDFRNYSILKFQQKTNDFLKSNISKNYIKTQQSFF